MLLTQLEYFVAVAQEQHFGRAAAACYVSPSALSEAIRKLETELGVPLVRRGRVFQGLTPEGELALTWARRMLADERALQDGLAAAQKRLAAEVRFGVIPSALAQAAALLTTVTQRNPLTHVRMFTNLTTEQIVRRLQRYELDAGLIHPSVDDDDLLVTPLYDEPLVLVGAPEIIPVDRDDLPGREVTGLPLALLEPHMRARQLLDTAFRRLEITLAPQIESDSVDGLLALARTGGWAAVVPRSATGPGWDPHGLQVAQLVEPTVTISIALAQLAEEPRSALAAAFDNAVSGNHRPPGHPGAV
ncbi:LysR family transcriptional regulator [Amycolatopsis ultiminotia]|uniref:LysR family transcriptional regulator n=1 Tax=Amycolatopsis ultiminotia TaxID=543629 RepID=A0ABP6V7G5_9PSEU